jgi:hypothetical protein
MHGQQHIKYLWEANMASPNSLQIPSLCGKKKLISRSRWRRSAVARLLGLRVRIPPGHGCFLWLLYVVGYRSLRRSDPSSRGASNECVCLSLNVTRCKKNSLQIRRVCRRCETKKMEQLLTRHCSFLALARYIQSTPSHIISPRLKWITNCLVPAKRFFSVACFYSQTIMGVHRNSF